MVVNAAGLMQRLSVHTAPQRSGGIKDEESVKCLVDSRRFDGRESGPSPGWAEEVRTRDKYSVADDVAEDVTSVGKHGR
jgi:hypothetical protein